MKKIGYIDTMRGVAILLVVICHCGYYVFDFLSKDSLFVNISTRGQIGVQLFFVASALTLCLSMEKRGYSSEAIKEFYLRRYFRIAPMYYFGILIYFIANFFFINRYDANMIRYYTPVGILTNVLFINGVVEPYNNTIVPGGWSIGTEMLFYAIFPALFMWLKDKSFKYILSALVIYAVVGTVILVVQNYISPIHLLYKDNFWYYSLLNQLPVFIWGFLLYKQVKFNVVKSQVALLTILIFGIGFFFRFWQLEQSFAASFFLVPFFAGMAMFAFGALLQMRDMNVRVLDKIGRLSFSIYIFHFLITHFLFPFLYEKYLYRFIHNNLAIFACDLLLAITFSYIIASATRVLIEEPGIKLGNKVISRIHASVKHDGLFR